MACSQPACAGLRGMFNGAVPWAMNKTRAISMSRTANRISLNWIRRWLLPSQRMRPRHHAVGG